MHTIFIALISLFASILLLAWSADRFVVGASGIATNFGVSRLLVGLTVVALGTSLPELLVSFTAALHGNSQLAVGNALGSNTANIGLVLGTSALIAPLTLNSFTMRREFPVLILVTLFSGTLLLDHRLSRVDGLLLLTGLISLVAWLVWLGHKTKKDPAVENYVNEVSHKISTRRACFWLLVGLVLLPLSSQSAVNQAVLLAHHSGFSDFFIGLSVMAIGTSLPELTTSIISAIKGEHDIAIGNVIGSNMFNLLGVMGIPGVIHPDVIDAHALSRDYLVMLILTLVLYAIIYRFGKKRHISRGVGALLLAGYLGYLTVLIYTS